MSLKPAAAQVSIVFGGGALGGIVSVMDAWADPVSYPLSMAKFFALFVIPFFKGGVASGIGVYVLTTLDSSHMLKAFFFSAACGLAFPSILAKGGSLADNVTSQVAKLIIEDSASEIARIASAATDPMNVNVLEIKSASDKIIAAEQRVQESGKAGTEPALQQAISTLSLKATGGDVSALQAIRDIGALSAVRRLRTPTETAIRELKVLQANEALGKEYRSMAEAAVASLEHRM